MRLALLLVAAAASLDQRVPADSGSRCAYKYVAKTVFHEAPNRLIYTVGLEHTGHHVWSGDYGGGLSAKLGLYTAGFLALAMRRRERHYNSRCEGAARGETWYNVFLQRDVKVLNDSASTLKRDMAIAQNGLWVGSCSYPCGPKSATRPDATFVAKVAEAADTDLRLVVMTRNPVNIVNDFSIGPF
mmetsp:Transcript_34526/g.120477  ORF Transcript_34526/g.120477 Transcript_34526/m.120477 type:complete len:186 (+) Transcript_34526:37-594(+)